MNRFIEDSPYETKYSFEKIPEAFHLEDFKENGYSRPFSLENPVSTIKLLRGIKRFQKKKRKTHFPVISDSYGYRESHLYSSLIFEISTDKAILNNIAAHLGPDLLLWIGQLVNRRPGGSGQCWHIDSINWEVKGIHASIAVTDMNLANGCLQVIPKTHTYQMSQAEIAAEAKLRGISLWDSQGMVALADELHPENSPHQLISLEMKGGQCLLTQGGLWHSVPKNTSDDLRCAVVARFMKTSATRTQVKDEQLPCILVMGNDHYHRNTLYGPPIPFFKDNLELNYRLNRLNYRLKELIKYAH